jgi:hypothetical protein
LSQLIKEILSRGRNCLSAHVSNGHICFDGTDLEFPIPENWEILPNEDVLSNIKKYKFPKDFKRESGTTPEILISNIPAPLLTISNPNEDVPSSISFYAFAEQNLKGGHNLKPRSLVKYEIMWSSWIFEDLRRDDFGRETIQQVKIGDHFAAYGVKAINFNSSNYNDIELALSILVVEINETVLLAYGISSLAEHQEILGYFKKMKPA